jgi:hypothetical protein
MPERLGELLIKKGKLTQAQLDQAVQCQILFAGKLGTVLLELGYIGEKDLAGIRVGSPVIVTPTGNAAEPFTAKVTSVFPFVDPGARTAVVEAVVGNAGRRLLPGQYVQMQFVTGEQAKASQTYERAISLALKVIQVNPRDANTLGLLALYYAKSRTDPWPCSSSGGPGRSTRTTMP